ncbi:hypothetical protein CMI37_09470 [Candidatus Pacearchaeota archaeon]|nr:hypothetical protein [Candidatus Pacearchaeota archaeon]
MTRKRRTRKRKVEPFDAVAVAVAHLPVPLATADLVTYLGIAVEAGVQAFTDGAPEPDTAEALMRGAVRLGMRAIPVSLPPEARAALTEALVAALGAFWRSMVPVRVEVEAESGSDLHVEVIE